MEPIYTPDNTKPAYQLNWGLTVFWRQTPIPEDHWLAAIQQSIEPDGVRILKHRVTSNDASQFFVSTQPHVAPSALIRSVKGRLQHLIRQRVPKALQRNYCLRSIGSAKRAANKHEERLSRAAIMSDHIHLTVGCPIERSPERPCHRLT
jgi:REP element-mobilizing transposase RayT